MNDKKKELIERYIKIHCGNYTDKEKVIVKNAMQVAFYITNKKEIIKSNRGGKRKGAGRPVTKEPTKVIRVPVSKLPAILKALGKV